MNHAKRNRLILGIYSLVMLRLLLGRPHFETYLPYWQEVLSHTNFTPFHTFRLYWRLLSGSAGSFWFRNATTNLLGNVLVFVPLGFLLPAAFPRLGRFWKTMLISCLLICAVELAQVLLLVGTCDIDDLLLNLLGTALGYGLYRLSPFAKI